MGVLEELQQAVQGADEQVGPSVVGLGRGRGFGSGVVIAAGRVLTNAHNLRREEVTLTFADERQEKARVAGIDVDGDLAVLEVDTAKAPAIAWSPDESAVAIGTPVFALANPGGRGLRVTFGLVSGTKRTFRGPRGRRIGGGIEHTAPLIRGSSGGPLVDSNGRLLGLNTLRLEGGLILALGADAEMKERVEALGRGESPSRVRLGLVLAPPRVARRMRRNVGLPELDGLLVRRVQEDGPAARAGIERGDLLVAAGGSQIEGVDDLYELLDRLSTSDTLELTVVRGTDERTLSVGLNGGS